MEQNLKQTISLLTRTPAALDALLRDLPDEWTRSNEGEGTWRVFDVVGHLIHGERSDWMTRVRTILEHGENRTFERFDREGDTQERQRKSLPELLDEFARAREQSLSELRALNLQEQDFSRQGRHPAFGVVTLSQLLATWAAHDLTHLHQVSRIMAHQYREAVGPWIKYLGVLHCDGHSGF